MKTITLKSLTLRNFKKIQNFAIQFDPSDTTIAGTNGVGKSTIFDAYTWLLYGKNSHDQQDFLAQSTVKKAVEYKLKWTEI